MMIPKKIKKKFENNDFEVEDILSLTKFACPKLGNELLLLSKELGWKHAPCFPESPFATWAEVTAAYCDHSYDGVVIFAKKVDCFTFAVKFLEDIPRYQSIEAMIKIGKHLLKKPQEDIERSYDLAASLNIIYFNIESIPQPDLIRSFLHLLLRHCETDAQKGITLLGLRWVGNETSYQYIDKQVIEGEHWKEIKSLVKREITKRMRKLN